MINRIFTYAEHEEFSGTGWRPDWIPGADPLGGMGVAHDILEHLPNDRGGAEGEFMALGAAYFIRGEPGYFTNIHSAEENLATDLPSIFNRIAYEEQTLCDPGVTYPIQDIDKCLHKIATLGIKETREYSPGVMEELPYNAHSRILGWLRKGYRAARQRYRICGQYRATDLFNQIEKQASKCLEHADYGDKLKVIVNLRRHIVSTQIIEKEEYY